MTELNNPAGRLYAVLAQYRAAARTDKSAVDTWCEVLEAERSHVLQELSVVAGLIPQLALAVQHSGKAEQQQVFDAYVDGWARPIFFPDKPGATTPSFGQKVISATSLATLGGLSGFLSAVAPEGAVPPDDQLEQLSVSLAEIREVVVQASEVPPHRGLRS